MIKKMLAIVYLCQVLTFGFAGLPLFIGVWLLITLSGLKPRELG